MIRQRALAWNLRCCRCQGATQLGHPSEPVPFIFGRIATRYEPDKGADLALSDKASLSVPAGAIAPGTTEISTTPLLTVAPEMAAPFSGPVVDIRIGDREHYSFRKPVTLTLPYEPAQRARSAVHRLLAQRPSMGGGAVPRRCGAKDRIRGSLPRQHVLGDLVFHVVGSQGDVVGCDSAGSQRGHRGGGGRPVLLQHSG